jgi:hypothetical protein
MNKRMSKRFQNSEFWERAFWLIRFIKVGRWQIEDYHFHYHSYFSLSSFSFFIIIIFIIHLHHFLYTILNRRWILILHATVECWKKFHLYAKLQKVRSEKKRSFWEGHWERRMRWKNDQVSSFSQKTSLNFLIEFSFRMQQLNVEKKIPFVCEISKSSTWEREALFWGGHWRGEIRWKMIKSLHPLKKPLSTLSLSSHFACNNWMSKKISFVCEFSKSSTWERWDYFKRIIWEKRDEKWSRSHISLK